MGEGTEGKGGERKGKGGSLTPRGGSTLGQRGAHTINVGQPPPQYFGSNSKNTHS